MGKAAGDIVQERVGSYFVEGQEAIAAHGRSRTRSGSRLSPAERHGTACDHAVCCQRDSGMRNSVVSVPRVPCAVGVQGV